MQKVFQKSLIDTMRYNGIPVFIYTIHYPCFTTTCCKAASHSINNYYTLGAKRTEEYCRRVLYPQAVESIGYVTDSPPPNPYTLDVDFKITYNTGCLASLYMDTNIYAGGAHDETKRTSNTWNFKTGNQLLLRDICPDTLFSLSKIQECMTAQVAERLLASPGSYFDNYETLLQEAFNPESYYLIPWGFIIYYQQYDIAPYYTGIPEFSFCR